MEILDYKPLIHIFSNLKKAHNYVIVEIYSNKVSKWISKLQIQGGSARFRAVTMGLQNTPTGMTD